MLSAASWDNALCKSRLGRALYAIRAILVQNVNDTCRDIVVAMLDVEALI